MAIISKIFEFILNLLPKDPFIEYINGLEIPSQFINNLNWFFPVSQCLGILGIWLTAISSFYILVVVLFVYILRKIGSRL